MRDKTRPMLPKGVATFLPEAAALKRRLEDTILTVFTWWGYQEVITPLFEYLDVISAALDEDLIEKSYKLVDRSDGRMMILRPDVTPQIARMVGMLMADRPRPLRLCYRANVFRHEEEHAGRARELFQVGGELVGLEGPEADAEVVAIAIQSLRSVGLTDFKVALGHSEFFRGLLSSLNLSPETQRRIKSAVIRKDVARLKEVLKPEPIAPDQIRAFLAIPELFGGPETIQKAERFSSAPACRKALKRLSEIYEILKSVGCENHLLIDLSELRGFDYYTGIVFEIFARDLGSSVARGGRYDDLIEKFGKACPSTGFAFNIEHLQEACQRSSSLSRGGGRFAPTSGKSFQGAADFLLVDSEPGPYRMFKAAAELREAGYRVIQQKMGADPYEAVRYAGAHAIESVVVLGTQDRVILINARTGRRQNRTIKALLRQPVSKAEARRGLSKRK